MPTKIDHIRAFYGRVSLFSKIVWRQAEGGRLKFFLAWEVAGICNDPKWYERQRARDGNPCLDDIPYTADAVVRPLEHNEMPAAIARHLEGE